MNSSVTQESTRRQDASRAATSTYDRFVEAGAELFWANGYHATPMGDIIRAAGSSSGNFYNFFEGKEELLLAVIAGYADAVADDLERAAAAEGEDWTAGVQRVFDRYRSVLVDFGFRRGCPLARLALEMTDATPPVKNAIREAVRRLRSAAATCISGAVAASSRADADDLAALIIAVLEGATLQAQAEQSLEPFDQAAAHTLRYLRSLSPR